MDTISQELDNQRHKEQRVKFNALRSKINFTKVNMNRGKFSRLKQKIWEWEQFLKDGASNLNTLITGTALWKQSLLTWSQLAAATFKILSYRRQDANFTFTGLLMELNYHTTYVGLLFHLLYIILFIYFPFLHSSLHSFFFPLPSIFLQFFFISLFFLSRLFCSIFFLFRCNPFYNSIFFFSF